MVNLTLTIDEGTLKRARIKALEDGTSVNAVVREYLDRYAGGDRSRDAMRSFLERAGRSTAASGPDGRTWTRDGSYEERLDRYGNSN